MDIPYSDPSPAIDYYMRTVNETSKGGDQNNGGDDFWGCAGVILCFLSILLVYYFALK